MDERYIAAVDLGSSKVAVTVAQAGEKGVQMIYYRETPSEGVRNSYVLNPRKAADSVRIALDGAEKELGIKIHQVVTGLPRYEVVQETARAELERSDPDSSITREEIDFLKTNAIDTYPLEQPDKLAIFDIIAQSFTTEEDINSRESDVEGMVSDTLEGTFKVLIGRKRHSDNIDRVMNMVGVAIAKKFFLPQVTAEAVLSEEERENGVALIEIGAGATSVAIYHNDILRYFASFPFGGRSITGDIKLECGTSEVLAENIKLAFGACMPEKLLTLRDKIIQIDNPESGSCKQLSVKYLSEVITCRTKEIVDACLYLIQESGLGGSLQAGIVLTGGGASLPNLSTFIKELSGYSVRIGYPRRKFSFTACSEVNETSATASVGMVMAAKDDKFLNCLSEAPARKEKAPAQEESEPTVEQTWSWDDEPVQQEEEASPEVSQETPVVEEEPRKKEKKKKEKEKEKPEGLKKKPSITWATPLRKMGNKISGAVTKLIDEGYDGMES